MKYSWEQIVALHLILLTMATRVIKDYEVSFVDYIVAAWALVIIVLGIILWAKELWDS